MIFGYTRVSTQEQTEGQSLAEQERKIRGVAMMSSEEAPVIYSDPGVSGTLPLCERPGGRAMLAQAQAGDMIVVAKLDRMFRDASDALATAKQLAEKGINLVLADISHEPVTHNGTGKLFFGILAQIADFERERIAERLNDGRRAKRKQGGHIGGKPPFGFRVEGQGKEAVLVEDPDQQEALKVMQVLSGDGLSLRRISQSVEAQYGYKLPAMSVKRILERHSSER